MDASWTTDLTSVVFVFPPFNGGTTWTLLPFFWMPQERVAELERICRVPYSTWIQQGFIECTPGNVIDQRAVMDRIRWGDEIFDLQEVPFDRFNFRSEAMNLASEGILTVEIQQTFLHLSHPTKFLLGAYLDQKIRHGNHPVLNWMASCLQLQYDHKDNCQPSKPERGKTAKRIDGIAAVVTALARATVVQQTTIRYTGLPKCLVLAGRRLGPDLMRSHSGPVSPAAGGTTAKRKATTHRPVPAPNMVNLQPGKQRSSPES